MVLVEDWKDGNAEVKTFSLGEQELKVLGQYFNTKFSKKAHLTVAYFDGVMLNVLQVNDKFTYDLPYDVACDLLDIKAVA